MNANVWTWPQIITSFVAVTALVISFANFLRDKGRVRARSKFYPAYEGRWASMEVELVNVGRRPITLKMLGAYMDGSKAAWCGMHIGAHPGGVRLGENEGFSIRIDRTDHFLYDHQTNESATDLWAEDTLGRRYRVKGAKAHLDKLFKNEVFQCGTSATN